MQQAAKPLPKAAPSSASRSTPPPSPPPSPASNPSSPDPGDQSADSFSEAIDLNRAGLLHISNPYHWLNGELSDSPIPTKLGPQQTLEQLYDDVLGPSPSPRPKTRDTAPPVTPQPPPLTLPDASPSPSTSTRTTWANQPQYHPPPAAQPPAVADAQNRIRHQQTQSQGLPPLLQRVHHRAFHLAPVSSANQAQHLRQLQPGYAGQPGLITSGTATTRKRIRKRSRGDIW